MATKKDLVDRLVQKIDFLEQSDVELAVDNVIEQIADAMLQGNRVEIRGFGSLSVRRRKFPGSNDDYKTTYYRMSKNIHKLLNPDQK
ncbi:MAG TPA: HU family DNA-binding protein [Candidatus Megaira endosymbiont of Nemacystus decipiens]|nr:HU family DNA-binding protein [Candidatus Megaera endosymbiont of Nemacystus decipiens]